MAFDRASRPKPAKLVVNLPLRAKVEQYLGKRYSPEQIVGRLKAEFPDTPEMWVSSETIYLSLYLQARGALRKDLTRSLRTGRAVRRPSRAPGQRKNRIPGMINIAERPAEAEDRAVPGHWEGDFIIGKGNLSAIGTLVERTTNFTMLVHLPDGYKPEQVAPALAAKIATLPDVVRRTLTWDQGRRCGTGSRSASPPTSTSTSATRTHRGNGPRMKTPMGCCGSTSRRAATCRCTPPTTSTGSPPSSTTDPARDSASASPSKRWNHSCCDDRHVRCGVMLR